MWAQFKESFVDVQVFRIFVYFVNGIIVFFCFFILQFLCT